MTGNAPPLDGRHPLLVEIQQTLDEEIGLDTLAHRFGYSPFHFHRVFTRALGETPKSHVERLRMEKAALVVAVTDATILEIALSVGFNNHETFIRAFKRAYGVTPRQYRAQAKRGQKARMERNRDFHGEGCVISEARFLKLPAARLLSLRHVGAYADIRANPFGLGDLYWTALADFAHRAGAACDRIAYGFFLDDPTVTPGPAQRTDFCLPVRGAVAGDAHIRCVAFEGGEYAVIEHAGAPATIGQAYRNLADAIRREAARYTFRIATPFQIFRETSIGGDPDLARTEIYFAVSRR